MVNQANALPHALTQTDAIRTGENALLSRAMQCTTIQHKTQHYVRYRIAWRVRGRAVQCGTVSSTVWYDEYYTD